MFCSDPSLSTVTYSIRVSGKDRFFVSSLTFSLSLLQMADPGQFPLPSFAGHHVIHSVQLFRKCWISTMAFTAALLAFVWSNLGWMWWLGVQGGLTAEWESSCLSLPSGLWAAQLEGLTGFSSAAHTISKPPWRCWERDEEGRVKAVSVFLKTAVGRLKCWDSNLRGGGWKQWGLFVDLHHTRELPSLVLQTKAWAKWPAWKNRRVSFCESLIRSLQIISWCLSGLICDSMWAYYE